MMGWATSLAVAAVLAVGPIGGAVAADMPEPATPRAAADALQWLVGNWSCRNTVQVGSKKASSALGFSVVRKNVAFYLHIPPAQDVVITYNPHLKKWAVISSTSSGDYSLQYAHLSQDRFVLEFPTTIENEPSDFFSEAFQRTAGSGIRISYLGHALNGKDRGTVEVGNAVCESVRKR